MTGCITSLPPCPTDGITTLVRQETPVGDLNCVNLSYTTANIYQAGTLEVYLDGRRLDAGLDFVETVARDGFTVLLDPSNKQRLNTAFRHNESLRVDYLIDPETLSDPSCITIL